MISIDNYFGKISDLKIRRIDLPPVLRKGWDLVNRITKKGKEVENYWQDEEAKQTIDLYFDSLSEFIEDEAHLLRKDEQKKSNSSTSKKPVIRVPELTVSYHLDRAVEFTSAITKSEDVAGFLKKLFKKGEIELQEFFYILFLDRSNKPVGYYRHSIGGLSSTVVDTRIILATALKSLSSGIILCHNHPSGSFKPSASDKVVTKQLMEAAKFHDILILDHIILTKDSYTSFADDGLLGVDQTYPIKSNIEDQTAIYELEAKALEIELLLLKLYL